MTHDLTKALFKRRDVVGAYGPEGRRLSATDQMLNNLPLAENEDQRANIMEHLARTAREIEQIQRDGGQYVHGNHGAQR